MKWIAIGLTLSFLGVGNGSDTKHHSLSSILSSIEKGGNIVEETSKLAQLGTGRQWAKPVARMNPDAWILKECIELHNKTTDDCVQLQHLVPDVNKTLLSHHGFEKHWSKERKEEIEISFGQRLRQIPAIQNFTDKVLSRTIRLLIEGTELIEGSVTNSSEILLKAFGWNGMSVADAQRFSGYVMDKDISKIDGVGNIREKWALLYLMNRNTAFDSLMHQLTNLTDAELVGIPIDVSALRARAALISNSVQPYAGVANFLFPVVQSWSRFSFDYPEWNGCRKEHPGCALENKTVSDPFFQPPLSEREKALQCLTSTNKRRPALKGALEEDCPILWCTGENKFYLVDTPVGNLPGFVERMQATGFRAVAGPSSTTGNMLQLTTLLGFNGSEDLSLALLSMLAWMLPANDHSLTEILLGAAPFFEVGN